MNNGNEQIFRLYIAGSGANSVLAAANLRSLCRTHLPDRHRIEIVDVLKTPAAALDNKIFLTPTLVRLSPGPELRIVGNLSETEMVAGHLGLVEPERRK